MYAITLILTVQAQCGILNTCNTHKNKMQQEGRFNDSMLNRIRLIGIVKDVGRKTDPLEVQVILKTVIRDPKAAAGSDKYTGAEVEIRCGLFSNTPSDLLQTAKLRKNDLVCVDGWLRTEIEDSNILCMRCGRSDTQAVIHTYVQAYPPRLFQHVHELDVEETLERYAGYSNTASCLGYLASGLQMTPASPEAEEPLNFCRYPVKVYRPGKEKKPDLILVTDYDDSKENRSRLEKGRLVHLNGAVREYTYTTVMTCPVCGMSFPVRERTMGLVSYRTDHIGVTDPNVVRNIPKVYTEMG